MTNSVYSIISFEKKNYRNKVSIYVFKYPGKKLDRQKVATFLASGENFPLNFLPTKFY